MQLNRTMPKLKKKPLLQPGLVKDFNSICWVCTSNWKQTTNLLFHCYLQRAFDEMPIRVQHFRLRLMRFSYSIYHVPRKDICTADALSRAPVLTEDHTAEAFYKEVNAYVNLVIDHLPATTKRLQEIKCLQEQDETCKKLKLYCRNGWPTGKYLSGMLKY